MDYINLMTTVIKISVFQHLLAQMESAYQHKLPILFIHLILLHFTHMDVIIALHIIFLLMIDAMMLVRATI